jgi:tetratricopeptide (TPR) repeat protein
LRYIKKPPPTDSPQPLMSDLQTRYDQLIDRIVERTLKGEIRAAVQVYEMLVEDLEPGTEAMFSEILTDRHTLTAAQAADANNPKQARATRTLRALNTIQTEWARYQTDNQGRSAIASAVYEITTAGADRLVAFLGAVDPNCETPLNTDQLRQLAAALQQSLSDAETKQELAQLAAGITSGVAAWEALREHLVGWMYERSSLGFGESAQGPSPWEFWSKLPIGLLPQSLFRALHLNQPVDEWAAQQRGISGPDWIALAIVLQRLQQGLVTWGENRIYDNKQGAKFSISVFLAFSTLWLVLAHGFGNATLLNSESRARYGDASLRGALQLLRTFAQRSYFPLYGNSFLIFGGQSFQAAMDYLNEPLKQVEGTTEKARILTLIASYLRVRGHLDDAAALHESAREIAQEVADRPCEIANLNHLSRISVAQKNFDQAINQSQRALILSRQSGDRPGEANALATLGTAEVFQAQALESPPESYELPIGYLEQSLALSENLGDQLSLGLCATSLGVAHTVLLEPDRAMPYIQMGLRSAEITGDLYIQAINLAQAAEVFYQRHDYEQALAPAFQAMYQLEQLEASEWQQPASLLTVLQRQLGEQFTALLAQLRPDLVRAIGVDGYDYLPTLLARYSPT